MENVKTFAVTLCACCIACSILSLLCSDTRMKKVVSLVMGAFIVCSLLLPLFSLSALSKDDINIITESADLDLNTEEAYKKAVLDETAKNLVIAADDLLKQENIKVKNIELAIKLSEDDSIYISKIYIYINKTDEHKADKIKSIIEKNMNKEPVIVADE